MITLFQRAATQWMIELLSDQIRGLDSGPGLSVESDPSGAIREEKEDVFGQWGVDVQSAQKNRFDGFSKEHQSPDITVR